MVPAILGPIIRPMWDSAILENMEVFTATGNAHQLPNLFTEQFIQWFVWIGGSGSTLALVIMFMFSKSKFLKELGRLSFVPGLFNINEPIIFGAPIVMNNLNYSVRYYTVSDNDSIIFRSCFRYDSNDDGETAIYDVSTNCSDY